MNPTQIFISILEKLINTIPDWPLDWKEVKGMLIKEIDGLIKEDLKFNR